MDISFLDYFDIKFNNTKWLLVIYRKLKPIILMEIVLNIDLLDII